jgi:serine/threonine protein kinase
MSRFEPGDVLGTTSRYQVTSLLGEGVFATVYRCIDSMRPPSEEVDSSADVAVKVLDLLFIKLLCFSL